MSSPLSTYLQLTPAQIEEKKLNQNPAFLDHLLGKLHEHIAKKGKILLITLTKKSSEEVTSFLIAQGFKAFYLHSEIATIDRWEIIKKLRTSGLIVYENPLSTQIYGEYDRVMEVLTNEVKEVFELLEKGLIYIKIVKSDRHDYEPHFWLGICSIPRRTYSSDLCRGFWCIVRIA